jgi:methylase of polypeptide subunit release factors
MIDIQARTNKKIDENYNAEQHEWTFEFENEKKSYAVFAGVFSPNIFLGTRWLHLVKPTDNFLEIGVGCGVTSIELALKYEGCQIRACDINEKAVKNTQFNMERHNVKFALKVSDMFTEFQGLKFDVIYWNYPFHPSHYEKNNMIEKGVRDPEYNMLDRYLKEVSSYLTEKGYLLLGFSEKMGDVPLLTKKSSTICLEIRKNWRDGSEVRVNKSVQDV